MRRFKESVFNFSPEFPSAEVHWAVPCVAEALFACSMLCIFTAFVRIPATLFDFNECN